ncbi:MAG: hypothetical protein KKA42_02400 [candidate division Zixibacteria bacterium]|nr:hypothetical protein [candidate division Zixibacteria bacterium]
MTDPQDQHLSTSDSSGYEKRDVNVNKVVFIGVMSIIIVVVAIFFVVDYFSVAREEVFQDMVLNPKSVPLRELRAREEEELNSYKVLDSTRNEYRIPIARAMELMADEAYREQTTSPARR